MLPVRPRLVALLRLVCSRLPLQFAVEALVCIAGEAFLLSGSAVPPPILDVRKSLGASRALHGSALFSLYGPLGLLYLFGVAAGAVCLAAAPIHTMARQI